MVSWEALWTGSRGTGPLWCGFVSFPHPSLSLPFPFCKAWGQGAGVHDLRGPCRLSSSLDVSERLWPLGFRVCAWCPLRHPPSSLTLPSQQRRGWEMASMCVLSKAYSLFPGSLICHEEQARLRFMPKERRVQGGKRGRGWVACLEMHTGRQRHAHGPELGTDSAEETDIQIQRNDREAVRVGGLCGGGACC